MSPPALEAEIFQLGSIPRLDVRDEDDEHSHGQHGSDPDKSRIGGLIHKKQSTTSRNVQL